MHIVQVEAHQSYTSLRGIFNGWNDIDGELLHVPYYTADRNKKDHRVYPPYAAWSTVPRTPVFDNKNPEPQDWNDADCKKNLADHKGILMSACKTGGISEEWQKKVIMAIAMQVRGQHSVLNVSPRANNIIIVLVPFASP